MVNKYIEVRLLVFLTLIILLCGCGGPSATKTGTTPPSLNKTALPRTPGALGLQSTATATPTPKATPTPTPTPNLSGGVFTTLSLGSVLPSDAQCAARVQRSSWEPRPANTTANHTNVYAQGYRLTGSTLGYGYQQRVTGNFTGTTDEILQWGACKWGIHEDLVRAQAVQESYWRQSELGDCRGGLAAGGCQSVGILQVKGADDPPTHPGTWPYAAQSTAFDVDYALAVMRACFEGKETWLRNGYHAGDLWGCIGRWFSGDWYESSRDYIANVKNILAKGPWLKPDF
jgi:autotransporter family porin